MADKPSPEYKSALELEYKILIDHGAVNPVAHRIRKMAEGYAEQSDLGLGLSLEIKILRRQMTDRIRARIAECVRRHIERYLGEVSSDAQIAGIQQEVRNLINLLEVENEFPGYRRIANQITVERDLVRPGHLVGRMPADDDGT